jgi:hypothetical protein
MSGCDEEPLVEEDQGKEGARQVDETPSEECSQGEKIMAKIMSNRLSLCWFLSWLPSAVLMVVLGIVPVKIDVILGFILISGSCYFGYAIFYDGVRWCEKYEESVDRSAQQEEPEDPQG